MIKRPGQSHCKTGQRPDSDLPVVDLAVGVLSLERERTLGEDTSLPLTRFSDRVLRFSVIDYGVIIKCYYNTISLHPDIHRDPLIIAVILLHHFLNIVKTACTLPVTCRV